MTSLPGPPTTRRDPADHHEAVAARAAVEDDPPHSRAGQLHHAGAQLPAAPAGPEKQPGGRARASRGRASDDESRLRLPGAPRAISVPRRNQHHVPVGGAVSGGGSPGSAPRRTRRGQPAPPAAARRRARAARRAGRRSQALRQVVMRADLVHARARVQRQLVRLAAREHGVGPVASRARVGRQAVSPRRSGTNAGDRRPRTAPPPYRSSSPRCDATRRPARSRSATWC